MRVYQKSAEDVRRGRGLIGNLLNKAVDILPIELHVPGYQYCGPGTKLSKRLQRGDSGINKLDAACKEHDIIYSKYRDTENRSKADRELAEKAWQRVKARDSSIGEKAAAWALTNIMKAKSKFGSGIKKRKKKKKNKRISKSKKRKRRGRGLYLRPYKKSGGGGGNKKKKHRKK